MVGRAVVLLECTRTFRTAGLAELRPEDGLELFSAGGGIFLRGIFIVGGGTGRPAFPWGGVGGAGMFGEDVASSGVSRVPGAASEESEEGPNELGFVDLGLCLMGGGRTGVCAETEGEESPSSKEL